MLQQKKEDCPKNCRLWLVILTAVDPSQLPRLRFASFHVHFNQQTSSLFRSLWDDHTTEHKKTLKQYE